MSDQLAKLVENLKEPRILVLGDMILDRYVWGRAGRISQEAPIPILSVSGKEWRPGGAANVVANALIPLGAKATACGVVGDDEDGRLLSARMAELTDRRARILIDTDRPTTVKTRFMGFVQSAGRAAHQMLRVDEEITRTVGADIERKVLDFIGADICDQDCLVIEDYGKGLLSERVLVEAIGLAKAAGLPVIVDPAIDRDFKAYTGATVLVPNRYEASRATGIEITDADTARAASEALANSLALSHCLVKLDRDGMFIYGGGKGAWITNEPLDVYDVTGAGDTVTGVFAALVAAGSDYGAAAEIANAAAGIECGKLGCAPVFKDEIIAALRQKEHGALHKLATLEQLKPILRERRRRGEKVAFTNGCFDLMHQGHIELIKFSRQQGDVLVVGMNGDRSVRELKGPGRPILSQEERAGILGALAEVDYIVVFDTKEVTPLIEEIKPDVLVKGGDYSPDQVVGHEIVERYGGTVCIAPLVEGISTTSIVERVRDIQRTERSED